MTDDKKKQPEHTFSDLFYNGITYFGAGLALIILVAEIMLFVIDFFFGGENVYLGIFTYIILPVFLIVGLILIPIGALRKRKQIAKGLVLSQPKALYIDPTIPAHRNAVMVFIVGTTIILIMSAIGSYKAFHYTESVHFCGVTCHSVMTPQYTVYQHSPHARVKCVECHIGEGANWYVRSKLDGARQVFRTMTDSFARPIPSPVHNLRPAKETCERCHWPGKFFSSFELKRTYFSSEESQAPEWIMRMLVRVGRDEKKNYGIHAHMYIDHDIYYVADDEKRQKISWIKSVDPSGREIVYTSPDSLYKEKAPSPDKVRKMDCMDCHNRPSHRFEAPYALINHVLMEGRIKQDIPQVKAKMMEFLSREYSSTEEAGKIILEELPAYYAQEHADFYAQRSEDIKAVAEETWFIFQQNFFPEMKARWDAYPDNIGHLVSPGCFRCHDGEHSAPDGKVITRDCTVCHSIIEQGPAGAVEKSTEGIPFRHPFNEDETWKELNCYDCHTGN